jgi:hypothetical protein
MTEEEGGRREKRKKKNLMSLLHTAFLQTPNPEAPDMHRTSRSPMYSTATRVSPPDNRGARPHRYRQARHPQSRQPSERLCDAIGLSCGCLRLHTPSSEASAEENFCPSQPHSGSHTSLWLFSSALRVFFVSSVLHPPSIAELVARVGLTVVCRSAANNPTILQSPSGRALLARPMVRCWSLSLPLPAWSSAVPARLSGGPAFSPASFQHQRSGRMSRIHGLASPPNHLTSLPRRQTLMSPTLPSALRRGLRGLRRATRCLFVTTSARS